MSLKNTLRTLFHNDSEYMNACSFVREKCDPTIRSYVLNGAITRLLALREGSITGTPREVVESLLRESNEEDIARELETVSRREKKGHADPDLECPRCLKKGFCISKQIHDRLGTDEGATRFIMCSACETVTRMR